MTKRPRIGKGKVLFIEMTTDDHAMLKIESAITGKTMGAIIRERLVEPLKAKHGALVGLAAEASR